MQMAIKVTGTEQKVTAKANKNVQPYSTKCQIDNVHLWNGTKDPYLYTANVTVYNEMMKYLIRFRIISESEHMR